MTLRNFYDRAVMAQRRGDLEEAEQLCRQVLETAPSSFAALHRLGMLRAQSGDTAEALELMNAALALDPDAPDALFDGGNKLRHAGRPADVLAADRASAGMPL